MTSEERAQVYALLYRHYYAWSSTDTVQPCYVPCRFIMSLATAPHQHLTLVLHLSLN